VSQTYGCQKCASLNPNRPPPALIEMGKQTDDQGFLCSDLMCPKCSSRGLMRVVQETPPCRRCGHAERTFVRGGATAPTPGVGVAPTDGTDFLRMMQSNSVPGGGEG
jgi:ribosomal protein L37AE/L43A